MNNYYDMWGRLHHKPCQKLQPSSNNGWIYTSYSKKLGLSTNIRMLSTCFRDCFRDGVLHRHPSSVESSVPISRDEILGMAYLGFLKRKHLNGWNFSPYEIPKFNIIKLILQLKEAHNKHRNYFWQNNLNQLYRFAFSVPLQDRAFILECWGESKGLKYSFYKSISFLDKKFFKPKNGIHWLKYGGEDRKKIMLQEFPEDHPLKNI